MTGFLKKAVLICVIYLAAAMIIAPIECIDAAKESVKLCIDAVIPSLFPFFVCSRLFVALGAANICSRCLSGIMRPVFGVPGSGALALVLGTVSGYPLGASCAASLYSDGYCTKTEAERLLAFCSNSGPLFIMGAVGIGILKSKELGILLYCAHISAAIFTGILFRKFGNNPKIDVRTLPPSFHKDIKNTAAAIGAAVADSVDCIFKVCGFVVVFAVLAAAVPNYPGNQFVYSALEITGGTKALAQSYNGTVTLPLISMFIAFSGVSVLMQTAAIIMPYGLSLKPYMLGKLVHGILAFLITILLSALFPLEQETFAQGNIVGAIPASRELVIYALLTVVSVSIVVFAAWLIDKIKSRGRQCR